jgi:hypothetical protein
MAYVIGILLALVVSVYATVLRLDRDRAFYPTVLIVIASYYVLFAVMFGSGRALVVESLVMGAFVLAASLGFRRSAWLVVAALAAHGVLDLFHGRLVANPGVPVWWPAFCLTYDLTAAAYLAWRLPRRTPVDARGAAIGAAIVHCSVVRPCPCSSGSTSHARVTDDGLRLPPEGPRSELDCTETKTVCSRTCPSGVGPRPRSRVDLWSTCGRPVVGPSAGTWEA